MDSSSDNHGDSYGDYDSDHESEFMGGYTSDDRPSQPPQQSQPPQPIPALYNFTITGYDDFVRQRQARHDDLVAAALATEKRREVPSTDEEMVHYAQTLFQSIKDTSNVVDNQVKRKDGSVVPAQAVNYILDNKFRDEEVEFAVWNILEVARDMHLGIEPKIALKEELKKEVFETFDDRMQSIINVCRRSKATCKQLLSTSFVTRLVAKPNAEMKTKNDNAAINRKRDIQNSKGRDVLKNMSAEEKKALGYSVSSPAKRANPSTSKKQSARSPKKKKIGAKEEFSPDEIAVPTATSRRPQQSTRKRRTSSNVPLPSSAASKGDNEDTDIYDSEFDPQNDMRAPKRSSKGRSTTTKKRGVSKVTAKSPRRPAVKTATVEEQSPSYPARQLQDFTFESPVNFSTGNSLGRGNLGENYHDQGDFENLDYNFDQLLGADHGTSSNNDQVGDFGYANEGQQESMEEMNAAGDDADDPAQIYAEQEVGFKKQVCRILEVPEYFADTLELWQLRAYARAYDRSYTDDPWMPTLNAPPFIGSVSRQPDGNFTHICDFVPELQELAITRGDILQDGSITGGRLHSASKDMSMKEATSMDFIMSNTHKNDVALGNICHEFQPLFTMSIAYHQIGLNNELTPRFDFDI